MKKGFITKTKFNKVISPSLQNKELLNENLEEVFKRACNTKYSYIYLFKYSNSLTKNQNIRSNISSYRKIDIRRYKLAPSLYKYLKTKNHVIKKNVYMKWVDDLWEIAEDIKYKDKVLKGDFRGIAISVDINKAFDSTNPITRNSLEVYDHYLFIGNRKGKESYNILD